MSHLSTIRLQLKNKVALENALKNHFDLQHQTLKGVVLGEDDVFVPSDQFNVSQSIFRNYGVDPGLKFVLINGEYELQTDLWAATYINSRLPRNFVNELKKRYAQEETILKARQMGLEVAGVIEGADGNLLITLTSGSASIQCSVNAETVSMAVAGVQGASCTELTAQLSAALGILQEQQLTQEYYADQQLQMLMQQQQIGGQGY